MNHYEKEQPKTIQAMFGSIAGNYDRANAILSFQMHKHWNKTLIKTVVNGKNAPSLIDLCCGTGEIAYSYLKKAQTPCITYLVDFCPEMLSYAKEKCSYLQKTKGHRISYLNADVEDIPLPNESVNYATMAYGIRNVKAPQKAIAEAYRLLAPGGRFGILELTKPASPLLKGLHWLYLKTILPFLGKWLTSNKAAYQYLSNSIKTFVMPSEVEQMLRKNGFQQTACHPLSGGIATIIIGQKPN